MTDSLDAKYRPHKLEDMVGQKVAVGNVEGMLFSGDIARSILISGPFGSGKTTLARLIARYLNCENKGPKDVCGECKSCVALAKSDPKHHDYIELNAANTRGINEIRSLIEVSFLAPRGKYKVICLDEAHQLTSQASQALLKPMEEPSKRTVWIICTTAPNKILPTIRSRCMQINIKKVKPAVCSKLVTRVAKAEGFELDEEVSLKIAENSMGHPRTALKCLQSVINYGKSKGLDNLTIEAVPEIIKDVIAEEPTALVEKYMKGILNGAVATYNVVQHIERPDFFLQLCCEFLDGVVLTYAGGGQGYIKNLVNTTPWKTDFGLKENAQDFADLLEIYTKAYQVAADHTFDAVNEGQHIPLLATTQALAITTKWPRLGKAKAK